MRRAIAGEPTGAAGRDYESMSLPELEAREREQREAFREAFGDLQDRLKGDSERVGGAARRAKEVLGKADELLRRHRRVALAASVTAGFAIGYSRRRVVAERPPSEPEEEYVLVRRERRRASPLRAAAAKLAGLAASEALQLAGQFLAERRAEAVEQTPAEPASGFSRSPVEDTVGPET